MKRVAEGGRCEGLKDESDDGSVDKGEKVGDKRAEERDGEGEMVESDFSQSREEGLGERSLLKQQTFTLELNELTEVGLASGPAV